MVKKLDSSKDCLYKKIRIFSQKSLFPHFILWIVLNYIMMNTVYIYHNYIQSQTSSMHWTFMFTVLLQQKPIL